MQEFRLMDSAFGGLGPCFLTYTFARLSDLFTGGALSSRRGKMFRARSAPSNQEYGAVSSPHHY